jgi:nucleoside-diphosphate-sugar epimerase
MRILVLGGTGFLSTAVVQAAHDVGHDVAALTRGRRGAPPEGVLHLLGDRDDAASLRAAVAGFAGGRPDAVIDTCGYTVDGARAAAEVLADAPAYVYVSSISAYEGWPPGPVADESHPTWPHDSDLAEYGPMKAESERVLAAATDGRALLARAGLIVGPGDRTLRLTWWLHRFATQDRVVVPDGLDQPIAVVDARDLAGWLVLAAEGGLTGPVSATGPVGMTTYGGLLEACRAAVTAGGGRAGEMVVVDEDRLLAAGVEPWRDLPLWLPRATATTAWAVGTDRARELGLPSRPVAESVTDTWRWQEGAGLAHPEPPASLARAASA